MGADIQIDNFSIIYFDGVCNLCNGVVNKIIDEDEQQLFKFASLQSDFAKRSLIDEHLDFSSIDSIVLRTQDQYLIKSKAAIRIAKMLGGRWRLFGFFSWVPTVLADFVYDWIAKNRYKWFGKLKICKVPSADLKSRFLDS